MAVFRPDINLYQGYDRGHPTISVVIEKDLRKTRIPDCVIIAGTTLQGQGAKNLATKFCRAVKAGGKKCLIIYVNKEKLSLGSSLDGLIDYRVEGDCDMFASLIREK